MRKRILVVDDYESVRDSLEEGIRLGLFARFASDRRANCTHCKPFIYSGLSGGPRGI
jgi:hypothetical protein